MTMLQGLNLNAVNVETDRRGFVPVNDKMQVLDSKGKPITNIYCIGDANGKLLAYFVATCLWPCQFVDSLSPNM